MGALSSCLASTDDGPVFLEKGALETASRRASDENKHMLVAFLGEGWSLGCKKFKQSVLETGEFKEFAAEYLVYFPVEARRRPKLSPEETAVLQSWVIHFDIGTYPTVILLAPDGQEILRHGYRDIDAAAYIRLLKAIMPQPKG